MAHGTHCSGRLPERIVGRRPQLTVSPRLEPSPPTDEQGVNRLRGPLTLRAAALAVLLWAIAFLAPATGRDGP